MCDAVRGGATRKKRRRAAPRPNHLAHGCRPRQIYPCSNDYATVMGDVASYTVCVWGGGVGAAIHACLGSREEGCSKPCTFRGAHVRCEFNAPQTASIRAL